MILFLDFDGVLHPTHDGEPTPANEVFCHLPRFESVLCVLTVLLLMQSSAAISLTPFPSAMSSMICSSRSVRGSLFSSKLGRFFFKHYHIEEFDIEKSFSRRNHFDSRNKRIGPASFCDKTCCTRLQGLLRTLQNVAHAEYQNRQFRMLGVNKFDKFDAANTGHIQIKHN